MKKIKTDALVILWVAVWFPLLKPFLVSTTLSQLVATFIILCIATLLLVLSKKQVLVPKASFFFLFLSLIIFTTGMYYGSPLQRLFSDSFRYLFFGIFVAIGYSSQINETKLATSLQKLCLYQVIFSCLVLLPPTYFFLDLFKGRLSDDELFFHFFRFSGSLGYPTEFGCFLLIPLIHLTEQRKLFSSAQNIIFTLVCGVGILASASRAAILMGFVYAIIYLISGLLKALGKLKVHLQYLSMFILIVCFGLMISVVVQFQREQLSLLGYVLSIFNELDSSILHRFKEISLSLKILNGELTVPTGEERLRPFGLDVLESFFGSVVIRFGWIGAFTFFVSIAFYAYYLKLAHERSIYRSVFIWFFLAYVVVSPFSEVIFRSKGTIIFGILFGICVRGIQMGNKKFRR